MPTTELQAAGEKKDKPTILCNLHVSGTLGTQVLPSTL